MLSGCFGKDKIPETNAVFEGLRQPIDTLADEVLEHSSQTHPDVILAATVVVVGFDAIGAK